MAMRGIVGPNLFGLLRGLLAEQVRPYGPALVDLQNDSPCEYLA